MDINGNNREFFHGRCRYTGCDVLPGNNVAAPCTRSSQIQRGEVTL